MFDLVVLAVGKVETKNGRLKLDAILAPRPISRFSRQAPPPVRDRR